MNNIFKDLHVFEMANNHQGSVSHGKSIITAMAELSQKHTLNSAVKLQYRQLDTFVHPKFRGRTDVPHIPRFLSTELKKEQFLDLIQHIKHQGLKSMVTPFDEESVAICLEHNVDILKVASCSATDWPLLEVMAQAGKPLIFSTGGLETKQIDNLVSFFTHKKTEFAIMHCVALYPTPNDKMNMAFLKRLKNRYQGIPIGYSGHEAPDNNEPVKVAISIGAEMLERHVGLPTETIQLNKYSMSPEEVEKWITEAKTARTILGNEISKEITEAEINSLLSLQRGVYAKSAIKKNDSIKASDIFFAMPCATNQLTSGQFGTYRAQYTASRDYKANEPIQEIPKKDNIQEIRSIIHEAKGLLYEARIHLGDQYSIELSHHYGLSKFKETGCIIVNIINREYCKKLIIVLAGQKHPMHYHKKKEETFQLLFGDLRVGINSIEKELTLGQQLLIERGAIHSFSSSTGAIFEEISTTHIIGDSYYIDTDISNLDPIQRKTTIENW